MRKLILSLLVLSSILFADRWSDFGIKSENIKEWKTINTNPFYIKKWIEAGVTTPSEAKRWKQIGVSNSSISRWKESIKNPNEAKKWKKYFGDYYSVKEWLDEEIINFEEAKQWKELKIYPLDTYKWKKDGFTIEDAKKYKTLSNAKTSRANSNKIKKSNNVKVANKKNDSVNSIKTKELKKTVSMSNNKTPKKDIKWEGIDTYNIEKFKKIGLTPLEAKTWIKESGLKSHNIGRWIGSGIKQGKDIARWKELTNNSITITEQWIEYGFTLETAEPWIEQGATLFQVIQYKKFGLKPNDIPKWKQVTGREVKIEDWIEAGITSPSEAKQWTSFNIELPKIVKGLLNSKYSTPKKFKSMCNKTIYPINFIANNPYNNLDSCMTGCFLIAQVISKNQVFGYTLTRSRSNKPVIINADDNLNKDFSNGAKVCGVFKITDTEKIELRDGGKRTANVLKRLSWFSLY